MTDTPHGLVRRATAGARRTPLLFVHGAYTGAWCWDEHFLPYFAARGYDAWAVDLRGHGASDRSALMASLEDYVSDVVDAARHIGTAPVLIGHSMGAVVVQRALARVAAPALVLLAPVPPQGLLGSSILLALNRPDLFNEINRLQMSDGDSAQSGPLRDVMFSPQLPVAEVWRHLRRMRAESQRALFDLTWPQYLWLPRATVPVLVMSGQEDRFFPPSMVAAAAEWQGTAADILPGLAHGFMLDLQWETAAARLADWLDARVA